MIKKKKSTAAWGESEKLPSGSEESATKKRAAYECALRAYKEVVNYMKATGHYDTFNMKRSPERAANALMEMIQPIDVIYREVRSILSTTFPAEEGAPMVISLNNRVVSLCPHHFLPVIYLVDMAYLPSKNYLGLSKPTRLADVLGKRPVLQERYTNDLADALYGKMPDGGKFILKTLGAGVRIRGWHSCMSCRGVRSQNANVITRGLRGLFLEEQAIRQEFDACLPPISNSPLI